jgi:AbiV family abortive infection protein
LAHHNNVIKTTSTVVQDAVRLCIDNAQRLLHNAKILLDNNGSDGLVYVLWSLAVEEFGKGILLQQQLGSSPDVDITLCSNHHKKFKAGFEQLPSLPGTRLGIALRVITNSSDTTSVVKNPLLPQSAVSVESETTGLFSDALESLDPTVALRLALIYVDWDENENCWKRPGQKLQHGGFVARWELNRGDLQWRLKLFTTS